MAGVCANDCFFAAVVFPSLLLSKLVFPHRFDCFRFGLYEEKKFLLFVLRTVFYNVHTVKSTSI